MISMIEVVDFQSHQQTKLQLHPRFNIITGVSGAGKSAFLRALNALFYNNMQGTSFIRIDKADNPDQYQVAARVYENNLLVTKIRGKKDLNAYTIMKNSSVGGEVPVFTVNRSASDVQRFDNVKTDVPDQVREALNIYPVRIDSNKEINIQYCGQFDPPFMLMESEPAKMKFLNTISGTAAVDLAVKEANSQFQKSKKTYEEAELSMGKLVLESDTYAKRLDVIGTAIKYLTGKIAEYKELQEQGEVLAEMQLVTDDLVAKYKKINALTALYDKVVFTDILEKVDKFTEFLGLNSKYTEILSKSKSIDAALSLYNKLDIPAIEEKLAEYEKNVLCQEQYNNLSTKFGELKRQLGPLQKVECDKLLTDIEALTSYVKLSDAYGELLDDVTGNSKGIRETQEKLDTYVGEYVKVVKQLKVCPVCNGPITDDVVEHIHKSL